MAVVVSDYPPPRIRASTYNVDICFVSVLHSLQISVLTFAGGLTAELKTHRSMQIVHILKVPGETGGTGGRGRTLARQTRFECGENAHKGGLVSGETAVVVNNNRPDAIRVTFSDPSDPQ